MLFASPNIKAICLVSLCCGWPGFLQAQSWTNTSLPAAQRADSLLGSMTFGEKIALVNGAGGPYVGNIPAIPRLGIPALHLQDGPAGVRVSDNSTTAFPAPITLAASWDTTLARQYGAEMGAQARGKGIHVLLGPMMNTARAYQAGRNFEGYGEEPVLAGAMAAAEVNGIQSQGVIATAKHFVCNDQETLRTLISSDVDERTRQEIYYRPFLDSVRAGAGAVMASYNRVNSRYACEFEALNATLKKQWGFNGFIMSDWGAGFSTVAGMNNGLDMEMYSGGHFETNAVTSAIQSGSVPSSDLDGMVHRILTTMFQFGVFDNSLAGSLSSTVTGPADAQFARNAAAEGTVLLQNNGGILPLGSSVHSIAVIGSVASAAPISTGGGSASVNLPYNVTPLTGITSRAGGGITVVYAQGDGASVSQAAQLAGSSDVAVVCVGQQTSEGSDRSTLSLPNGQDALVSAVAAANPRTIVVLYSSSATLMPWANQVAAVLAAWYPGQENGNALAQVLFGDVNPSGKLPVTIPSSAAQVPTSTTAQFPGVSGHVAYSEQLLVGYRWFDANGVNPLFPFGSGLSYTTFGYSNLTVSAVSPSGQVQIGFDLTNTGSRAGAEVPQLYLGFPAAAGEPPRLLKGFQRVTLAPAQTQHVTFNLNWEDLANWDASTRGWIVHPGLFQVSLGASSRDIRLSGSFNAGSVPSSDLADAALHQPASASSQLSTNTPASAALDGDPITAWTSLAADPQWIVVDLGVMKDLSRVRLNWGTNFAAAYQIQISSDDTNWTGVYSTTSGLGGIEDILVSGRARYVRIYGTQHAGTGSYSLSGISVFCLPQRPLRGAPWPLPGRIEAENYDTGGQGVGYFNPTAGNPGGSYRTDDVGIQPTDDAGGGYNVGWLNSGEWLEYTVNPPNPSAIYSISVRVAAATGGGQLRVTLDGNVLGVVAVPNTGGAQNWQMIVLPNVPIPGGNGSKALRLEALTGGFNINWIELDAIQACGTNNIALNRTSSASSVESGSYPAASAFDGDPTTRWSSGFSDPQWVQVDLGSVQNIGRVRLIWEAAFGQSYSIQLSTNGSTWTTAYTTTNGPGGINDLAVLGAARYVRMNGTKRATSYGYSLHEFEVYPAAQEPSAGIISPAPGTAFVVPTNNFSFTVTSSAAGVPTNGIQLILNGIDVSSALVFAGSALAWTVTFPGLLPNLVYSVTINVTDANGLNFSTTSDNAFDTFSQTNLMVEAEDFDFGNGAFIDDPAPTAAPASNSYFMESIPAAWGVDVTTSNDVAGELFAYRNDPCGTEVAADVLRQKYSAAGVSDYDVGWWRAGQWLNYTRTFPTNTYSVYGRLASDDGDYDATLSLVTDGRGTPNQTTQLLGTFSGVDSGGQAWQWVPLLDSDGTPVFALGGLQTLKMTSQNSLNANFYLFLPVPLPVFLNAYLSNGSPVIACQTQPGFQYMLVSKNSLREPYWKLLSAFAGDGTVKHLVDATGGAQRFYKVVSR